MLDTDLYSPIELFPGESDDDHYRMTLAAFEESPPPDDPAQPIPAGLDEMAPGPFLAAILSSIDVSRLKGRDVVVVLRAQHRQVAHHQAGEYEATGEVAFRVDADTTARSQAPNEFAIEEVGSALTLTRRKADHELSIALDLRRRLPSVHSALKSGHIDARKASLLAAETSHMDARSATDVVDRLLPAATHLTSGQLRARLQRLCLEADPDSALDRMKHSLTQRRVVAEPNPEGTATLIISESSPADVYAARDHINYLARRLKTEDEPRTIDQLRADVALALLSGSALSGSDRTGTVNLNVDLTTLAGLDRRPGELAGYGHIVAELAREVAVLQTDGDWTATVTDPETGEPLTVVALRRRPTIKQLRKIRALHPTCTFPGCRMPATGCDIDHIVDYAGGGRTLVSNQTPLCRRHHRAKHVGKWRYRKTARTRTKWTSPLGHTYHTAKPP